MIKLIIDKIICNKPRDNAQKRLRAGIVGGICGISVNILLSLIKALAGIVFHSIALLADAVNNMTDAASSVITLIGFKLSAKKPDSEHPYGHGRVEYISGLIMSFIVLMLGLVLVKTSFDRILHPEEIVFSWVSVAVLVISILMKLWLSAFFRRLHKLTGSATFKAASVDSRNDVITTFAVLVSTAVYAVSAFNIDGYTGLAVSVFIIISGIGLIKSTLDPLLGQPPEKELVEEIYRRTMSYEGIIGIHDLVVHNYGPGRIFASLHAEVPAAVNITASHDIIDNIEHDFKENMGLEMVIHIDPIVTDDPIVNGLRAEIAEMLVTLEPRLSMHDFRMVTGPTHTNIIFDVVVPADVKTADSTLKAQIDGFVKSAHPDCNAVITFDRSYI